MGHMLDAHSKWMEARTKSDITAPTTKKKKHRQGFAMYELLDAPVTNNGSTISSKLFSEYRQVFITSDNSFPPGLEPVG